MSYLFSSVIVVLTDDTSGSRWGDMSISVSSAVKCQDVRSASVLGSVPDDVICEVALEQVSLLIIIAPFVTLSHPRFLSWELQL